MAQPNEFEYNENNLAGLRLALSEPRINSYLTRAGGNPELAFRLYVWNTQLSEAMYMPLQSFEVGLRNSSDRALTAMWGDSWYEPGPLAGRLQVEQIQRIQRVLDRHSELTIKVPLTKDFVIANLSFAFWVDLFFFREYEKLWQFGLHTAFPNRQKGTQRSNVAAVIKSVHTLRNRVAHHEPIAWSNPPLDQQHTTILKLICWISPDTESLVKHHSKFGDVWTNKPV